MRDDLQGDIQATAEDIAADSEILQGIETEKASLDATDPRALELAAQAEKLAHGIAAKTVAERELVVEANGGDDPTSSEDEPQG
jgi:hypothetical protein